MPDPDGDAEQAVREAAYFIWEREGRPEGRAPDHWRRAVIERAREERRRDDEPEEEEKSSGRTSGRKYARAIDQGCARRLTAHRPASATRMPFTGRFAFSGLPQNEAPDEHQGTPDKEADVPVNPLVPGDSFVDVVNAKQLMVHDALSKIENAEAHQQRPGEQLAGPPHVSPMCGSPQQGKSGNDKNVSAGVEDTVEKRVQLKVIDAVGGIPGACDHVVPLKQLMEDDPVKETSQPQAE